MRKVWIGAGVVAGLAATVAAVPYFLDWNWFKPQMIAAVESATGYEVEVAGDVEFALLPRPALTVNQVAITGFGAERQPLIRAEQLSAAVAFWPLLSREVEVDHIALKTPVVRLVSYADGSSNWARADEQDEEPSSTSMKIADFRIDNGTLIRRSADGSELRFDDIDARLSVPSLDGPYGVDGTLRWNGLPVALEANYAQGGGLKVDADIEDAGRVSFAGRLPEAAADAPQAIAGTLTISAPSLDGFLDRFSDKPDASKPAPAMAAPMKVAARLSGTTEAMRLSGLSGTLGGSRIGGDLVVRFAEATDLRGRLTLDAVDAEKWMPEESDEDAEPFSFPEGYTADVLLSIGRLSYGKSQLGQVNAPLKFADKVLTVGRAAIALPAGARAAVQGVVDTPEKLGMRIRGTLTAEVPRPSATLLAFRVGAPANLPPLTVSGAAAMTENMLTLSNLRGRFDGSPYAASVRYPLLDGQPVDVTFVADRINLDRLRGDHTLPAEGSETSPPLRFNIAAAQMLNEGRAFEGVKAQGIYNDDKVTLASASAKDAMGFAVQGKGTVYEISGAMNTDLAVSLVGVDTRGSVAVRGPAKQMTVNGTLAYSGATVGIDGWVRIEPQIAYQIDVDAKAAEAARLMGQTHKMGPLALTLRATGAGDRASLTDINGRVGPMELSGSAVVNTAGVRPVVTATLRAGDVPLDRLWGASPTGAAEAARNPGARWSKEPLDFAFLDSMSGKLTFTAQRLSYDGYVLESPSLIATANGRQLTLNGFEGQLYGGKLAMSGALDAAGVPAGNLKLSLGGVPMEPLMKAFAASSPATGTLSMTGSFAMRGRSQHEMIDNLSGPVRIAAENGVINKVDLDRLNQQLGDLRTVDSFVRFASTALGGGQTPYKTLSVELQGSSGRFAIERVITDMVGGSATANGVIDLAAWAVDVDALLKLGSYDDAPAIPATIKGALSEPAVNYSLGPIKTWFGKRAALAGLKAVVKGEGFNPGDLLGIKKPATSGIAPGAAAPAPSEQVGAALPTAEAPAPVAEAPAAQKSVNDELKDVVKQGLGKLFKKKAAPAPAEAPAEPAQPQP